MSKETEKTVLFSSDDFHSALDDFGRRQATFRDQRFAFADTRHMVDPPKTTHRYVVMRLVEKKD